MKDFIGTEMKAWDFFLIAVSSGFGDTVQRYGIVHRVLSDSVAEIMVYVVGSANPIYETQIITGRREFTATNVAKVPASFVPSPIVDALRHATSATDSDWTDSIPVVPSEDDTAISDAVDLLAEHPTTFETPGVHPDGHFDTLILAARRVRDRQAS